VEIEITADAPTRPPTRQLRLLPAVQRRFGRYELLCRFATGGMANLYLARFVGPSGFKKLVAIKRIHEHLTEDKDFVNMFVDEARLAARIEHPNVVQVIELGAVESSFFIVMEYVPGESLVTLMRKSEPTLPICARIISEAALGLHAAHELRDNQGDLLHVVHRDVSPGNIIISYQGVVKVADFGVARAKTNIHTTAAGTFKGKFAYMAPEQARSAGNVDRRADVFSLGIVLYEITTRKRLFKADSEMVTMAKVLNEPITPPSKVVSGYPEELDRIVMRALQRDREKRFQTAQELHAALGEYLASTGTPTLQATVGEFMQRVFADRIAEREQFLRSCEEHLESGEMDDLPEVESPSAQSLTLNGTLSAAHSLWRRRQMTLFLIAALFVVVGLAIGFSMLRSDGDAFRSGNPVASTQSDGAPVNQPTGISAQEGKVHILVKVIPDIASLSFSGKAVHNPYDVWIPATDGEAEVFASAPGYVPRTFKIPLSEGTRLVIALDREAASRTDTSVKRGEPGGDKAKAATRRRSRRAARRSRRSRGKSSSQKLDKLFDSPY
jgi:serine/threonine protein kinase